MAKEIGYEVDVLRDLWGPGQWPLDVFVADPKDKKLVRENAPMIELIWNLIQVQLPRSSMQTTRKARWVGTGSSTPSLALSNWYADANVVIGNCWTARGTGRPARKP